MITKTYHIIQFFFREFQPIASALYYQIKTPINFWYRQGLKLGYLIQSWEILSVELAGTYNYVLNFSSHITTL